MAYHEFLGDRPPALALFIVFPLTILGPPDAHRPSIKLTKEMVIYILFINIETTTTKKKMEGRE
jgi:hypothetical protein